ncbi:MAG: response regulator transcription factor [Acidobacteria bacterium]|nr:response regulator transcription factor [Acidobacteriota bacterium]
MIRILLADDHNVVRKGLRRTIEEHNEWEVCGETSNGREAVALALELKPDIVVLDLTMPDLNGIEATRQIKKILPQTEILIFTMHESEEMIHRALEAGARGFILKSDDELELVEAIKVISRHRPFFTAAASEALLDNFLRTSVKESVLTDREREVVQLLAEGKANKEVAVALDISVKTAETHRAAIMRKLEIDSLAELVRYAIRNHLINP